LVRKTEAGSPPAIAHYIRCGVAWRARRLQFAPEQKQMISSEEQEHDFEPSVPFVACFSACMVMAETIAYLCGWESKLEPRFQFDFLRGLASGLDLPQARRQNCVCRRANNIRKLRASRHLSNNVS
jgi:hypothetical protein